MMGSTFIQKKINLPVLIVIILGIIMAIVSGFFQVNLPWYIFLGGLVFFVASILIFRTPVWGIILVAFFLPFERLGAFEFSLTTIRLSQVFLIVTAVAWLFQLVIKRQHNLKKNPVLIPLALFLLVGLMALPSTLNLERSLTVFIFIIFTVFLALIIPNLIDDRQKLKKITTAILFSFVVVVVFGIFQFAGDMIGLPQELTGLRELYTKDILGFTRVQSTAYEPLYFANYLLIPIALVFALFLSGRSFLKSGWMITILTLGMINLVLTVSRGGYLALFFTLVVVGIFYFKKLFTVRNVVIFFVGGLVVYWVVVQALGLGGGLLTIDQFSGHVLNVFYGASYDERVNTFENAFVAWRENPVIGLGFGGFGPYMSEHPFYVPKDGWRIVNNEFIEIMAENGILGLFFFAMLIIVLIIRSIKAIKISKDSYNKAVMVALLAAFVGILAQYQTFSTLYIMHVWFLIGLMVAVQNIIFKQNRQLMVK